MLEPSTETKYYTEELDDLLEELLAEYPDDIDEDEGREKLTFWEFIRKFLSHYTYKILL